jgi:Domain of unknown function (DUF1906)
MDPTVPGVDYAWSHPGGAALHAAGKKFACRYLSRDPEKNLTRAEADDLATHGVWSVVVWETTAARAGAGRAAGVADAERAVAQAAAAGMPSGRPVYFAVDYDADPAAVVPYFQGVASVIGLDRTGGYGGFRVIKYLLDQGLITWAWQTAAWSRGQWDPRAVIRQPATTVRINGVSCDDDTAHASDYGQWMPGRTPTLEDPMANLDADDLTKVRDIVRTELQGLLHVRLESLTAPGRTRYLQDHVRGVDVLAQIRALGAQVGAQGGLITALTTAVKAGGGLTAEQATAAAQAGAQAALDQLADALTKES